MTNTRSSAATTVRQPRPTLSAIDERPIPAVLARPTRSKGAAEYRGRDAKQDSGKKWGDAGTLRGSHVRSLLNYKTDCRTNGEANCRTYAEPSPHARLSG